VSVAAYETDNSLLLDTEDEENAVPASAMNNKGASAMNNKGAQHLSGALAAEKTQSKASPRRRMDTDQRRNRLTSGSHLPSTRQRIEKRWQLYATMV
jgi:hypothetical protein